MKWCAHNQSSEERDAFFHSVRLSYVNRNKFMQLTSWDVMFENQHGCKRTKKEGFFSSYFVDLKEATFFLYGLKIKKKHRKLFCK